MRKEDFEILHGIRDIESLNWSPLFNWFTSWFQPDDLQHLLITGMLWATWSLVMFRIRSMIIFEALAMSSWFGWRSENSNLLHSTKKLIMNLWENVVNYCFYLQNIIHILLSIPCTFNLSLGFVNIIRAQLIFTYFTAFLATRNSPI